MYSPRRPQGGRSPLYQGREGEAPSDFDVSVRLRLRRELSRTLTPKSQSNDAGVSQYKIQTYVRHYFILITYLVPNVRIFNLAITTNASKIPKVALINTFRLPVLLFPEQCKLGNYPP